MDKPTTPTNPPTHSLNSRMMVTHAHVCLCNCYLEQATLSYKLFKHIIKPYGMQPQKPASLTYTHTLRHTQTPWQVLVQIFRHMVHSHMCPYINANTKRGHYVLTASSLLVVRSRRCSLGLHLSPRRLYCTLRALIWNSFLRHTVTPQALMLTIRKYSSLRVWATLYITFQRFAETRQPLAASEELWKPCVRFQRTQLDITLEAMKDFWIILCGKSLCNWHENLPKGIYPY